VLANNLKDLDAKEEEKSEAAGLLAQVTSPWIENNSSIEGLTGHLDDLVKSLTGKSNIFIKKRSQKSLKIKNFNLKTVKGYLFSPLRSTTNVIMSNKLTLISRFNYC